MNFSEEKLDIKEKLFDEETGQYQEVEFIPPNTFYSNKIHRMVIIQNHLYKKESKEHINSAMKTNSKISKGLYTKLGEDVDHLKKRIANNISRGIATADSYENIARNISNASNVGFNNNGIIEFWRFCQSKSN